MNVSHAPFLLLGQSWREERLHFHGRVLLCAGGRCLNENCESTRPL
jgi:hypothetical protein